jgi:hypothetical protein
VGQAVEHLGDQLGAGPKVARLVRSQVLMKTEHRPPLALEAASEPALQVLQGAPPPPGSRPFLACRVENASNLFPPLVVQARKVRAHRYPDGGRKVHLGTCDGGQSSSW